MTKIVEIQYFPCVAWFNASIGITNVKIEQYENFGKTSFRNRCVIPGANGLINMTLPVIGGREQKTKIREVLVDHSQPWAKTHWKVILSNYRKAPFFEYYQEEIKALLLKKEKYLFDFNINIINWLSNNIGYSIAITNTSTFIQSADNDMIIDFREKIRPNNFQSHEFFGKEYQQMFSDKNGFQQNVSMLDLLMCQGKNSINFLL